MGYIVNRVLLMFFVALVLAVCLNDPELLGQYIPDTLRNFATGLSLTLSLFAITWYATFEPGKLMRKFGRFSYLTVPEPTGFQDLLVELWRHKDHSMTRRTIWRLLKSVPDIEILREDSREKFLVMRKLLEYPATFSDEINDLRHIMHQEHKDHVREILGRVTSNSQNRELHIIAAFQALLQCMWFHEPQFSRRLTNDLISALKSLDHEQRARVLSLVTKKDLTSPQYLSKTPRDEQVRNDYLRFVEMVKFGL